MSSPEQELAKFLASKPAWLQKVLQQDFSSLLPEEQSAWVNSHWFALDGPYQLLQREYEDIIRRLPAAEWKKYRKSLERLSPMLVPKGKPGRRRDSKAGEYAALHPSESYRQMAKKELQSEPEGEAKNLLIEKERERIRQSVRRSRRRKNT
ncbi:MAG: hypothetical protein WAU73_14190 [Candidatus Sulfotelmatobacter sp.]